MKVYLIRHAKTKANEEGRYTGKTDVPISEAGREITKALRPFYGIDKIYVSSMLRARETASMLFPDSKAIIYDDLREMDFGHFEGRNFDDLRDDPEYIKWVDAGGLGACPGGEDPEVFSGRVTGVIKQIITDAHSEEKEIIYIVTHGGVIMTAMYEFTGRSRDLFDFITQNNGGWSFETADIKNDIDGRIKISDYFYFDDTDTINRQQT